MHPLNKTCYVTIIVYLHKTPVTSQPWNKASYVMITVDRPSPSTINVSDRVVWLRTHFTDQHNVCYGDGDGIVWSERT